MRKINENRTVFMEEVRPGLVWRVASKHGAFEHLVVLINRIISIAGRDFTALKH